MPDTDAIDELLTRAGMLMEDASARLVIINEPAAARAAVLRSTIKELLHLSSAVTAFLRRRAS